MAVSDSQRRSDDVDDDFAVIDAPVAADTAVAYQRAQALVLRLVGTVELLAFGAAFMPAVWMSAGHQWLGLGELTGGPVVESVMRQVSFVYGLHGIGMWVIASDLPRYRPLVVLSAIGYLLFGIVFFVIDMGLGLPKFWVLGNSGATVLIGILLLGLLGAERSARNQAAKI